MSTRQRIHLVEHRRRVLQRLQRLVRQLLHTPKRVTHQHHLLRRLKARHRQLGIRLTSHADVRSRPIPHVDPPRASGRKCAPVRKDLRSYPLVKPEILLPGTTPSPYESALPPPGASCAAATLHRELQQPAGPAGSSKRHPTRSRPGREPRVMAQASPVPVFPLTLRQWALSRPATCAVVACPLRSRLVLPTARLPCTSFRAAIPALT